MTGRRLHLAVAQVGGISLAESRRAVVARLVDLLEEAHSRGATVVVFPELTLTTFFPRYWMPDDEVDRFFERAMPSPEVAPLFDRARELGVGFYLGYAELTEQAERYNTAVLVDRSGTVVGRYRKIHLPGHVEHKPHAPFQHLEKRYFSVGDLGFGVWEAMGAKIGMALCNDRRWPEAWRVMGLQGAEVMLMGYNTPSENLNWREPAHLRVFHHLLSVQAGAYQNSVWAAVSAKCGTEDGHHLHGGSVIVAPTGEIAARATTEDDEVIDVVADLELGRPYREHVFDFARHRRPEEYRLVVERTGRG